MGWCLCVGLVCVVCKQSEPSLRNTCRPAELVDDRVAYAYGSVAAAIVARERRRDDWQSPLPHWNRHCKNFLLIPRPDFDRSEYDWQLVPRPFGEKGEELMQKECRHCGRKKLGELGGQDCQGDTGEQTIEIADQPASGGPELHTAQQKGEAGGGGDERNDGVVDSRTVDRSDAAQSD